MWKTHSTNWIRIVTGRQKNNMNSKWLGSVNKYILQLFYSRPITSDYRKKWTGSEKFSSGWNEQVWSVFWVELLTSKFAVLEVRTQANIDLRNKEHSNCVNANSLIMFGSWLIEAGTTHMSDPQLRGWRFEFLLWSSASFLHPPSPRYTLFVPGTLKDVQQWSYTVQSLHCPFRLP